MAHLSRISHGLGVNSPGSKAHARPGDIARGEKRAVENRECCVPVGEGTKGIWMSS